MMWSMDYQGLLKKVNAWTRTVNGRWVDLDGFPPSHPYQCHDLWLSYLRYLTPLSIWHGHAPGAGWTDEVWKQFPKYRPELKKYFTKVKGRNLRAGDVVFWPYGDPNYPLSHVAIALSSPNKDGYIRCVSQNWGSPLSTRVLWLPMSRVLGALRPIVKTAPPKKKGISVKPYQRRDKTANGSGVRKLSPGKAFYLNQTNTVASQATNIVGEPGPYVHTMHVYGKGTPGDKVLATLLFSDTRVKPARRSWHYTESFEVQEDGSFEGNVTFQRAVTPGYAVYAHVRGPNTNKRDVNVTMLATESLLIR